MGAARKRGTIRLARSILIPLAGVVGLSGLAGPAGASSRPSVDAGTLANVVSVASNSGSSSYCGLLSTGKVDCWGDNGSGQLGNGTATNSDVPVAVLGISDAKAVASDVDGNSFCAVLSTGHVKCWGYNDYGELGNGTTTTSDVPVSVKNITTATAVVGGRYGFCALLSTKHLDCWGYNGYGELGNGTTHKLRRAGRRAQDHQRRHAGHRLLRLLRAAVDQPRGLLGVRRRRRARQRDHHRLRRAGRGRWHQRCQGGRQRQQRREFLRPAVDRPGEVLGVQRLRPARQRDHDELRRASITAVGISKAKAIANDSNGQSFCAVLSTGQVKCWGYNGYGELGNGTTTTFSVPVSVKNITTATTLSGAYNGFCALLSTEHLDCWGYNGNGQLGNGTFTSSDVPVAVRKITNAATLTGSYDGYCTLLSTSHVDCWGYGGYGELGNGTFSSSDVPVAVLAAS